MLAEQFGMTVRINKFFKTAKEAEEFVRNEKQTHGTYTWFKGKVLDFELKNSKQIYLV